MQTKFTCKIHCFSFHWVQLLFWANFFNRSSLALLDWKPFQSCSSSFLQAEFESQLKSCDAIIVMYSLTDRVSFHVAREILDDLANLQNITCPVILLANKMDLCHHRKVIHSVWKLPKMSHLNFLILAFSANFCPLKTDLSGNTVWPQASGFQKHAKMDHFGDFF